MNERSSSRLPARAVAGAPVDENRAGLRAPGLVLGQESDDGSLGRGPESEGRSTVHLVGRVQVRRVVGSEVLLAPLDSLRNRPRSCDFREDSGPEGREVRPEVPPVESPGKGGEEGGNVGDEGREGGRGRSGSGGRELEGRGERDKGKKGGAGGKRGKGGGGGEKRG